MQTTHKIPPQSGDSDESADARAALARMISRYAPHDGLFDLPLPGVHLLRTSTRETNPTRAVTKPGMCIIAQGAKRVLIGQDVYDYDNSRMAVYSTEVPVSAKIVKASVAEPYLCLIVDIEPQKLAALTMKAFPNGVPRVQHPRALFIGKANPKIVEAGTRLLELLAQPKEAEFLQPLIIDEIFIRLLRSDIGTLVAQIAAADSSLQRISKAISWIREHFKEAMKVEELAALSNMSVSAFHTHFKTVTRMTPLQFQKELRLHEARQMMLTQMMDVSTACMYVGYSSVSQFSREYSRLFGVPPSKDARSHLAVN
ncbi:AraC family transcriptional regulator [Methylophaga sp.]|uniref:AraC family transcriptional regulator n=1 Tax=Methylophaga sp. TaxID=2024840 RepID=UPI001400BAFC|nr:AraC family transcriptional regulator [Methylophaga sp.]MTI64797.1 AraC family transcriptional regulator [Methylophaga sp.]